MWTETLWEMEICIHHITTGWAFFLILSNWGNHKTELENYVHEIFFIPYDKEQYFLSVDTEVSTILNPDSQYLTHYYNCNSQESSLYLIGYL